MPGTRHHSDKWHSCWEKVQGQGKDESAAAAICTASLGDESYDDEATSRSAERVREFHVLGAIGKVRRAMHDGREHVVVPLVALMEGVIHAINAETPEYVPTSALRSAPQGWNGRPVMLGHPIMNGVQVSANSPDVLSRHCIGTVFETRLAGNKLLMEAWLDPLKIQKVPEALKLLQKIENGDVCEVSVGAFVLAENKSGVYNGKSYKGVWKDIIPDHLAFLPKGVGACSVAMGCGTHRSAQQFETPTLHLITAEGVHVASEEELRTLAPMSDKAEVGDYHVVDKSGKRVSRHKTHKEARDAAAKLGSDYKVEWFRAAGGTGSGWFSENGHVPGSSGASHGTGHMGGRTPREGHTVTVTHPESKSFGKQGKVSRQYGSGPTATNVVHSAEGTHMGDFSAQHLRVEDKPKADRAAVNHINKAIDENGAQKKWQEGDSAKAEAHHRAVEDHLVASGFSPVSRRRQSGGETVTLSHPTKGSFELGHHYMGVIPGDRAQGYRGSHYVRLKHSPSPKIAGGAGSGWTREGGHTSGSQGGHDRAAKSHEDAARAHLAAADGLKNPGKEVPPGTQEIRQKVAIGGSLAAARETKASGSKPYAAEAAATYANMAKRAKTDEDRALYHSEAASMHEAARAWHKAAGQIEKRIPTKVAGRQKRELGGPGSGWTKEGGHTPGSQGGDAIAAHDTAITAHQAAAVAHRKAAETSRDVVGSRGEQGPASELTQKAMSATSAASDAHNKVFDLDSDPEYNNITKTHPAVRASEHAEAAYNAETHKSAASFHEKAAGAHYTAKRLLEKRMRGASMSTTTLRTAIIKHEGDKWNVYSEDGSKKLGEHSSEDDAKEQLKAIEANKHKGRSAEELAKEVGLSQEGVNNFVLQALQNDTAVLKHLEDKIVATTAEIFEDAEGDQFTLTVSASIPFKDQKEEEFKNLMFDSVDRGTAVLRFEASPYDSPAQVDSEESAELVSYKTMRELCDVLWDTYEPFSSLIDQLIAAEENPTTSNEGEAAETELEQAQLESMRTYAMSMYSGLNAVMSLINSCMSKNGGAAISNYAGKMQDCPTCEGTGTVDGNTCKTCDGKGEIPLKAAAGARHSAEDREVIQNVHDYAVTLGAKCPEARMAEEQPLTPELPRGSGEEGDNMKFTKEQRQEVIRTLVADKHSGFAAGDEKQLEVASDDRLEAFRVAAEARSKEVKESKEPKQLTEEDFMRLAPESLRTLITRTQAAETSRKAELVAALKTCQEEYSESELSAMNLEQLERVGRLAKLEEVEPPMSFAGRAIPRSASKKDEKEDVFMNPPDPYAPGIKKLRDAQGGKSDSVN